MPDRDVMYRQLAGDIWEGIRGEMLEVGGQAGENIRAEARAAAAEMLETVRRGYLGPERPGEDAKFRAKAKFGWQYGVFKVRKFCADWLPVCITILTALFILQFGKTFFR